MLAITSAKAILKNAIPFKVILSDLLLPSMNFENEMSLKIYI